MGRKFFSLRVDSAVMGGKNQTDRVAFIEAVPCENIHSLCNVQNNFKDVVLSLSPEL